KRRSGATAARAGVVVAQPFPAGALAEHAAAMRAASRPGRLRPPFSSSRYADSSKTACGMRPGLATYSSDAARRARLRGGLQCKRQPARSGDADFFLAV